MKGAVNSDRFNRGYQGVVFSSPECLLGSGTKFITNLEVQKLLMAICVDESHCVVKWGQVSKQFAAFRESYGRIAEVRSLVPKSVPLLALTATSSLEARQAIIGSLGMCAPVLIIESPEKVNIRYSHVQTNYQGDNPECFRCFVNELQVLGPDTPRTIIFCRTHRQVRNLYSYFREVLSTELMSHVAMFHSTTEDSRKVSILESFQSPYGAIRLLFCTIAFGMGVNVKGVTRVIHFGPPESLEDYVQESGRAGRDGEQSFAILVTYRGCTRHKVSTDMKEYFQDTEQCKRELLLQPFGSVVKGTSVPHQCCDACARKCRCADDSLVCIDEHRGASAIEIHIGSARTEKSARPIVRDVQQEQLSQLEEALREYHANLLPIPSESADLICGDVAIGFPIVVIDWILRDVKFIDGANYLHRNYPFFSCKFSDDVWGMLCRIVGPPSVEGNSGESQNTGVSCPDDDSESESSSPEDPADSQAYRGVVQYSSSDSN